MMTQMQKSSVLFVAMILAAAAASAAKVEKRTLTSRGKERSYVLYVPDGVDREHPAPLVVTLHGSGRRGSSLVDKWKGLATEEKIVLAGPDSSDASRWAAPEDGPQFLYDLVEELKKNYPIDARRVYLFGHSAGACFALQIGLLESEYFAAIAIHAGALQPDAYSLTGYATRKIPFAIFVGTRDPFFPLSAVRATRDELQKQDLVAELTEIRNHTHDYYGRSGEINKAAWAFLKGLSLAAEPKFTRYANM